MVNKKLGNAEITEAGVGTITETLSNQDIVRLETKIDDLTVKVEKMIESVRIFKLNFQQTNMLRK